jgi:AcrR family transcriptional regulator
MAYQVTKLIAGREYRYHVEGFRDPRTQRVKQRWTYLGRVKGNGLTAVRRRSRGDVRTRILAAALDVLDKRDVTHVTIDVLVRAARVSRTTFYRHFSGRTDVLSAAVDSVYDQLLEIPFSAEEPLVSAARERARLASWIQSLLRAVVQRPGIHRVMLSEKSIGKERAKQARANRETVLRSLIAYLKRLDKAGIADIGDATLLANAISCMTSGVVKQLVYDRRDCAPDLLIAGASELICRAIFSTRASASAGRTYSP